MDDGGRLAHAALMSTTETDQGSVLAGVDDSDGAVTVARVATRLARQLGVALTLVHVAHPEKHYLVGEKRLDVFDRGERLLRRVSEQAGVGAAASLRVELGDPASALLDVADEVGAQLLVVGSRGRDLVRSSLLGSVSQQTIARMLRPVVVVPAAVSPVWDGVKCIVVGIDDTLPSGSAAAWAGGLARRLGARLILVHVSQNQVLASAAAGFDLTGGQYKMLLQTERQSAFELLYRAMPQAVHTSGVELVFEVGDPAAELQRVADRRQASLIIIGAPARGGLHRAVHGGLSRRLAASAHRPLTVISASAPGPMTMTTAESVSGHTAAAAATSGAISAEAAHGHRRPIVPRLPQSERVQRDPGEATERG